MLEAIAQEIVNLTSEVIGLEVLITDCKGVILGTSDKSRIGSLHEASLGVIFSKTVTAHARNKAQNLKGVKPGVTIPIEIQDDIVGTIGITGEPKEVIKYAVLAKKYAEVILREDLFKRQKQSKEYALENLIQEISLFNAEFSLFAKSSISSDVTQPQI